MVKPPNRHKTRARTAVPRTEVDGFDLTGQDGVRRHRDDTSERGAGDPQPERKGVLVRMPRALWRELRLIALDHDTTLQAIMVEAAQDYLRKRNASGSDRD